MNDETKYIPKVGPINESASAFCAFRHIEEIRKRKFHGCAISRFVRNADPTHKYPVGCQMDRMLIPGTISLSLMTVNATVAPFSLERKALDISVGYRPIWTAHINRGWPL